MLTVTNAVSSHFPPFTLKTDIRINQHLSDQPNAHALTMPMIPSPQPFYDTSLAVFPNVSVNPAGPNPSVHMVGSVPIPKPRFDAPPVARQPITISTSLSQNLIGMKAPIPYLHDTGSSTKPIDAVLYRNNIPEADSSNQMPFLNGRRVHSRDSTTRPPFVARGSFPLIVTSSSAPSSFIPFETAAVDSRPSPDAVMPQASRSSPFPPPPFLPSTSTSCQRDLAARLANQPTKRGGGQGESLPDVCFNHPRGAPKREPSRVYDEMTWDPRLQLDDHADPTTAGQENAGTEGCCDQIVDGRDMNSVCRGGDTKSLAANTSGDSKGASLRHSIESILKMDKNSQSYGAEPTGEIGDEKEDSDAGEWLMENDSKRELSVHPDDDVNGDDGNYDDDDDDIDGDDDDDNGGAGDSVGCGAEGNFGNAKDNSVDEGYEDNDGYGDGDDNVRGNDDEIKMEEDEKKGDYLDVSTSQDFIDEEEHYDEGDYGTKDVNIMAVDVAAVNVDDDAEDIDVDIISQNQDTSCYNDLRLSSGHAAYNLDTNSPNMKTKNPNPTEPEAVEEMMKNDHMTDMTSCRNTPDREPIPGDLFAAESNFRTAQRLEDSSDETSHHTSERLDRIELLTPKQDKEQFQQENGFSRSKTIPSASKRCITSSIHPEEKIMSARESDVLCPNTIPPFPPLPPFQTLLPSEHTPSHLSCPPHFQRHLDTHLPLRRHFNHLLQGTHHQAFLNSQGQCLEGRPQKLFDFLEDESQRSAFKPIAKTSFPSPPFSSMHCNNQCKSGPRGERLDHSRLPVHASASGYLDPLYGKPSDEIINARSSPSVPAKNHSVDEFTNLDAISLLRFRSNNFQCPGTLPTSFTYSASSRSNPEAVRAWLTWLRARNQDTALNDSLQSVPSVLSKAPPPRYHCGDCNKTYSTSGGLSKHRQFHCALHVKKEFACKICTKSYSSLGALKMHIRTHTLPCKCHICGKAFSRPWLLQGHVRTHTGEKPFRCNHCGRAFADRSNLRAHLQTHAEIKKYACVKCGKTFSRMSLLTKHSDGSCPANTSACV